MSNPKKLHCYRMDIYNIGGVLVLVFVYALVNGGKAQESTTLFPAIITFGDSSVDVGNNNYLPTHFKANYLPYGMDFINQQPTGRFCNGKLVVDFTAEILGFKTYPPAYLSPQAAGKNLLIGASFGSAASGFDEKAVILNHAIPLFQQLKYFKEYKTKLAKVAGNQKASSIIQDALYILSAGTADFLQNYYFDSSIRKAYTPSQYSSKLVSVFSTFVKDLYGLGARKIGVTSLAPLGCLPAATSVFGYGDENSNRHCLTRLNNDAQAFNKMLNSSAVELKKQLLGLKIVVFDIFNPLYDVVNSPSKYGFVEARRGCCGIRKKGNIVEKSSVLCKPAKSKGTCSNATQYVFWDSVHPSEAANQVVADAMVAQAFPLI
ncbi:hypothetical protein FNV43_RR06754 [Rhamnella rubrinervis]|uniref:GDSL esterase/lipase APG n=1 Tax=Rhamnella rubrinervis TaxID=2594499 RepID=A0A8K0MM99_9ROSA|nr:hypothetical protein FNV43_RR06754 [Rhamnella rubrinervis]